MTAPEQKARRPMIFSTDRAYEQLRDEGVVLTARTRELDDRPVWIRRSRTGPKDDEVPHARRHRRIHDSPIQGADELIEFAQMTIVGDGGREHIYELAGFDSADAWLDAIRDHHGEIPDELYIYRVEAQEVNE